MSKIQTFLQNILSSRYGKDVRQSIHDAIEEVDKNADTAKDSATAKAEEARKSALSASNSATASATSETNAKSYMESAKTSAANAKTSETNAKTSETNAKASETNAKVSEENAQAVYESLPEDYNTLSEEFYEVAIKQTASGEQIHTTDSANAKVREFSLLGKATQKTTSGKNLIPYPYEITTNTVNGITWTDNGDGTVTANGTATADSNFDKFLGNQTDGLREKLLSYGEVVLTGCPSGGGSSKYRLFVWGAYYVGEALYSGNDYGNGAVFTFNNNKSSFGFSIQIKSGVTVSNLLFKPMLRFASIEDDTWEPYTDGIASPNPSYPQDIEVSGASGSIEVKSVGKNLIPYPYVETTLTENGIVWTDNGDGTVTADGTASEDANFSEFILRHTKLFLKAGTYTISGIVGSVATYYIFLNWYKNGVYNKVSKFIDDTTFTLTQNDIDNYTLRLGLRVMKGVTVSNLLFKPMIRLATDTDDTYEPYKETSSTIPTPNGLAGIKVDSGGNYTDSNGQQWICDEIVKYADGFGEFVQRIDKTIFDGVMYSGGYYGSVEGKVETLIQMNLTSAKAQYKTSRSIICDKFKTISWKSAEDSVAYSCRQGSNGACCCYLPLSEGVTDATTGKAWLQENPVTVYYILKEPIRTQLTAEEIAEIEKLCTFYPVTNISNDSDCGMKVTYLADGKNYIDNQLALQAQAQEEAMAAMLLLLPGETQAAMIENDTNNLLTESEE